MDNTKVVICNIFKYSIEDMNLYLDVSLENGVKHLGCVEDLGAGFQGRQDGDQVLQGHGLDGRAPYTMADNDIAYLDSCKVNFIC